MASYNAINKAVAEVVFAAKQQVVKDFAAFLAEKIDFDEDMQGYFDEFIKTIEQEKPPKAAGKKKVAEDGTVKKKREPSAYNMYIKHKMAEIKAKNPEMKGKELMKAAIEAWNADKAEKASTSNSETEATSDVEKKEKETDDETSDVEEEAPVVEKPAAKGKKAAAKGKKATA